MDWSGPAEAIALKVAKSYTQVLGINVLTLQNSIYKMKMALE